MLQIKFFASVRHPIFFFVYFTFCPHRLYVKIFYQTIQSIGIWIHSLSFEWERERVLCQFAVKYRNYLYFGFLCYLMMLTMTMKTGACWISTSLNVDEFPNILVYSIRKYQFIWLFSICITWAYERAERRARAIHDECATNEYIANR